MNETRTKDKEGHELKPSDLDVRFDRDARDAVTNLDVFRRDVQRDADRLHLRRHLLPRAFRRKVKNDLKCSRSLKMFYQ